jgi:hypothetical protein
MIPTQYTDFTQNLLHNLQDDPRVLGLVALGSMAQQDYLPDQWSDHDFFVITQPGTQDYFRQSRDWLPDNKAIVLHFQETAHGVKVLYQDAHLLEFAIFDREELNLASVNRYRVLLDRSDIEAQLQTIRTTSMATTLPKPTDDAFLFNMFVTNLSVGIGRYYRGEQLSGHEFVKIYGLGSLLRLLEKNLAAHEHSLLDNFNPWRRVERVYPSLGQALNAALLLEIPAAAKALLDIAERELANHIPSYPAEAVATVYRQIL